MSASPWLQDEAQEVDMTQEEVQAGPQAKRKRANALRRTNLQRSLVLLEIKNVKATIVCSEKREGRE